MLVFKKHRLPLVVLLLFAMLVPVAEYHSLVVVTGLAGVFLVLSASLMGLKTGLAAAVYSTLVIIAVSFVKSGLSYDITLAMTAIYLTSSVGIGWVVDRYEENKTIMEDELNRRIQVEEKLRYLSFHDKLTGLYNRNFFEEEMNRLDTPRQLPISIIMGDVNCLKLLNDTFGHHEGDKALKLFASIMRKICRKEDIICRWGGDEFVILLAKTEETDASEIGKRIQKEYGKFKLANSPLGASIGVGAKTEEGQDIEEILKLAENRMYRDKLFTSQDIKKPSYQLPGKAPGRKVR